MSEVISYADAVSLYPVQVQRIVATVRMVSRSKFKNDDPATWKWTRGYAVEGIGGTFADVLRDRRNTVERREAMTPEQRVDDQLRRTTAHLSALNLWETIPADYLRERWLDVERKADAERARIAALTPAARAAELNDALATLRKGSGFVEITVTRPAR